MNERHGRQPDVSGIFGETVALLLKTMPAALLLVGVVSALAVAGQMAGLITPNNLIANLGLGFVVGENSSAVVWLFGLVNTVVGVVASYLYLRHLLVASRIDPPGGTRIWAYVGLTILSTLGIMVGTLALVVPGIVLLCRWSAAPGYLVSGREGIIDSLGKSFDQTRGHCWAIFAAGLAFFGIYLALALALGGALETRGHETAVGTALVESVGTVVSLAFGIGVFSLVHDRAGEVSEVFA